MRSPSLEYCYDWIDDTAKLRRWGMSNGQHGWSVQTIAYMPVRDRGCWMAVGQIRTTGNLGTLMRTACAAGADGFFFLGDGADAFHPQAVRASMGAIFGLPLVRTNATHLRRWTQKHGIEVIGASPDGDVSFNRATYGARVMLMIGEERRGLTAEQRTLCDQLVRIPMQDNLDSLNAAVAGSLLLYEVLRPASG
jgi:TrmH family RNA methyltransferase